MTHRNKQPGGKGGGGHKASKAANGTKPKTKVKHSGKEKRQTTGPSSGSINKGSPTAPAHTTTQEAPSSTKPNKAATEAIVKSKPASEEAAPKKLPVSSKKQSTGRSPKKSNSSAVKQKATAATCPAAKSHTIAGTKHVTNRSSGSNSSKKTGHRAATSNADTDAKTSSTSGSTRTKSGGGLLTARYQRHSSSPGEPVTPSFGDVRTIICDVSPVPSDVESIDYARISKTVAERRGLFSVGRSQQTLRVGRSDKNNTHSLLSKGHHLHSENVKSQISIKSNNDIEEPTTVLPIADDTNVNSKVAVRIVPDSAKSKVLSKGPSTKSLPTFQVKPHIKDTKQRANTRPSLALVTIKQSAINTLSSTNKSTKMSKTPKNEDLESAEPKTSTSEITSAEPKTSTSEITPTEPDSNLAACGNDTIKVFDGTPEADNGQEAATCDKEQADNHLPIENAVELSHTVHIPADEECCKAYSILNGQGIKVSLHTLRRALLTPTEYRMLQSGGQPNPREHPPC